MCVYDSQCVLDEFEAHITFLSPLISSLSSLHLSVFAILPPLLTPSLHLGVALPRVSLSQEEVNNMTFNQRFHEFPCAQAFLSHSHRFVFAPGSSVFLRNDHRGTRWLTSSSGDRGGSQASAGSRTHTHAHRCFCISSGVADAPDVFLSRVSDLGGGGRGLGTVLAGSYFLLLCPGRSPGLQRSEKKKKKKPDQRLNIRETDRRLNIWQKHQFSDAWLLRLFSILNSSDLKPEFSDNVN